MALAASEPAAADSFTGLVLPLLRRHDPENRVELGRVAALRARALLALGDTATAAALARDAPLDLGSGVGYPAPTAGDLDSVRVLATSLAAPR